jgi:chromosome segregation ATPase
MASYDDASNEVYMSVEEIEEELTVQRIMLSSMDDSCQNRDEAEAEVKAEIRELERQLRSLKQKKPTQNFTSHRIASANGTTLQDDPFAEDVFSYSSKCYIVLPSLCFAER